MGARRGSALRGGWGGGVGSSCAVMSRERADLSGGVARACGRVVPATNERSNPTAWRVASFVVILVP